MTADQLDVIEDEAARILAAYAADPGGRVPWSDRWTVNTVARHVAGAFHTVAQVIDDRPTATFERFAGLEMPAKGDPAFPGWFAAGTAALIDQLSTAPLEEVCWIPNPGHRGTVAYWRRRMANETLVHRWDAEAGAGVSGPPMDPERAADALDEYLDVGVGVTREVNNGPAGPTVRFVATDAEREWFLDLGEARQRTLRRDAIAVDSTLRGGAEALLLWVYGRLDADSAGVQLEGDSTVIERWSDLVPPA